MGSYDAQRGLKETLDVGGAIASQAGLLAEQAKEKASDVADRASEVLSTAQERGSKAASDAGEVVGTLRDALVQSARRQPGTTVLLSIAAGFLLGAMWKSGR
jgi:ElaB/YqjD/DUF883 family membrane-anchored ribosome-binding protein